MKKPKNKTKVMAIYSVPSSLSPGQQCASFATQLAAVARAADRHGLDVVADIELMGVTGCIMFESDARRAALKIREMLRKLNDREIEGIVVSGLDRLPVAYNFAGIDLFDGLAESKGRIYADDQSFDLASDAAQMSVLLRMMLISEATLQLMRLCAIDRALKRKEWADKVLEQYSTDSDGTTDDPDALPD